MSATRNIGFEMLSRKTQPGFLLAIAFSTAGRSHMSTYFTSTSNGASTVSSSLIVAP